MDFTGHVAQPGDPGVGLRAGLRDEKRAGVALMGSVLDVEITILDKKPKGIAVDE
jgi:hypothetical protein